MSFPLSTDKILPDLFGLVCFNEMRQESVIVTMSVIIWTLSELKSALGKKILGLSFLLALEPQAGHNCHYLINHEVVFNILAGRTSLGFS